MDIILKYFNKLTDTQKQQFAALGPLYEEWNSKINVISRKDIENLYQNHVLHSLAIAKFINLKDGSKILDLGTGGGFPGIPLAIFYPNIQFLLVDSIGKKLTVINEVATAIGLSNATMDKLVPWTRNLIATKHINPLPNGLIALKGMANIKEEIKSAGRGIYTDITPISQYFSEEFFQEKCVVYAQY
jgi:16S rRNA (guanine527-N7)-methyltransferase